MRFTSLPASAALLAVLTPGAFADLTPYAEDFEALGAMDPAALTTAGFLAYANVFDPAGNFLYPYGPFGAPNGGPGFSAIVQNFSGPPQGTQHLSVYSDYNNGDHGNGNFIEALVYREQFLAAGDVGDTWRFSFDHLRNPIVTNGQGTASMFAFVKVLEASTGTYAPIFNTEVNMTMASTTVWGNSSIDIVIDPSYAGELLQIGFYSYATDYDDTSVLYDNLEFSQIGGTPPTLAYSQDFENLGIMDPDALKNDGYKIFANVFDPMGNRLYGYGVFDAPNGGPGFSAIGTGDGGPAQGLQYLNVYSDYNNGDHANGNYIEALVFQERGILSNFAGQTWRLQFDVRRNPTVTNGEGDSTMFAFIKVLQSSNGSFADLEVIEVETTAASDLHWATYAIDVEIDPAYVGELLQFGFRSVATNYNDTGRFYDNITFTENTNPGIGTSVCLGNRMSNGEDALLTITGSDVAANNNLTLSVEDLPLNSLGFFLHSGNAGTAYFAGNSEGHICIAGMGGIGRFDSSVLSSGATGQVSLSPDLTSFPGPTGAFPVLAGDTRYFQYWSRDSIGGVATSNFSGASSVTFQ